MEQGFVLSHGSASNWLEELYKLFPPRFGGTYQGPTRKVKQATRQADKSLKRDGTKPPA